MVQCVGIAVGFEEDPEPKVLPCLANFDILLLVNLNSEYPFHRLTNVLPQQDVHSPYERIHISNVSCDILASAAMTVKRQPGIPLSQFWPLLVLTF